ncbi:MAG: ParB/RepB/Spo0J family partition protein [Holophagaceae bacterium]
MNAAKRPALGKGLKALMQQRTSVGDGNAQEVLIDLLTPNRAQPRITFNDEALDELSASIKTHGIIQPIVTRKVGQRFEIIAGERRWRAAKKAGLVHVPIVVREVPDNELLEYALVENIQREELNPIEEGRAYWNLGNLLKYTQEQVADRVGKSRPQVANTLRLLKLPTAVQTMISERQLSIGHAKVLLSLESPRLQEQVAREVIDRRLSVRALEVRVNQLQSAKILKKKKLNPNTVFLKDAAEKLTQSWSTRVEIKGHGKKGILIFHYSDAEQLDRLYEGLKVGPSPKG